MLADPDRIVQVFTNLIGNAMKFTPKGGSITLAAKRGKGEVVFWVADTGRGILEDHLPHLFDWYWQAGRVDRRGAGLGLAICKGIIEAHRGKIWVESEPGTGSTFFFTLPVAPLSDEDFRGPVHLSPEVVLEKLAGFSGNPQ